MSIPSASVLRARLWARGRIRHLQVLVRVAELGSLHKAAAAVGMTQPAVSHQLAELERLLETRLFQRHMKGARMTQVGSQLLPLARRILQAVDEISEHTAAAGAQASGVVRIVAGQSGQSAILSEALPQFAASAPDIAIHVRESDPASVGSILALAEADLAVVREPKVVPQGWEFRPLMRDRLVVIAGRQHPLAARKRKVQVEELRAHAWLALPVDAAARDAFEHLFAGGDAPRVSRVTTRAPSVLWAMLTRLDLLAIAPESLVHQFLAGDILGVVPIAVDLPLPPLGLLLPAENRGAATERFAAFLTARQHATGSRKAQARRP